VIIIEDLEALNMNVIESETDLRKFAENADVVFWICEPDVSKFHYISPGYEKIWGRSCSEIYDRPLSFLDTLHPDDVPGKLAAIKNNPTLMDEEYRIIRPDGEVRWVRDRTFPIKDDMGNVYRMVGIAEDITDRKKVKDMLVESNENFQQFAANIDIAFWVATPDVSKYFYMSPGYEKIWGKTRASLFENPHSFLDAVHPDDLERVTSAAIGDDPCNMSEEYRIIRPDGEVRWVRDRTFPVKDENGKIYRMVGLAEDITGRKQLGDIQSQIQRERITHQIIQAIRTSLNLETIFDIAVNEIGRLLQIDHVKISEFISEEKGWLTVAEYRSHPNLPKSTGTYIPDKGNAGAAKLKRLEIFRVDDTNNCEGEVNRKIAQTFPGAWLILPLHFDSVVWGSLCLLIDGRPRYWQQDEIELITNIAGQLSIAIQQSKLYQQIQELASTEVCKALQRERELSEAKSKFITNTSHEIRTPLATIQSSLDMLQYYSDKLDDEKKWSHFQKIEIAIKRTTQIVQDILLLSETEADALQSQRSNINAIQLCHEMIGDITSNPSYKTRIKFDAPGEKIQALIDPKLTQHILTNLLQNALKYSPQNTPVQLSLISNPDSVTFVIQDQGIGIPQQDLPHIFGSFYRANNVGNTSGTGLGLAIVKQCVDLQNGAIAVDSVVAGGTKFTVTLPKN
jgi:PAS domain S-box-containing protein